MAILERMMSQKCRERYCGPLQAPDVLPGREGHSKVDILFACWGQNGVGTPKEPGHCILCTTCTTAERAPAQDTQSDYVQGAVTGNTKEASGQRTTAFLQGGLAIAARWGQVPP